MAKSKTEKEQDLAAMTEELRQARGVVFSQYRGLTVKQLDAVRRSLRQERVSYRVVKVSLLRKALAALGINTDSLTDDGPVAVAISAEEETAQARVLKGLTKDNPLLILGGGVFNQAVVGSDVVLRLAALPTKQQLLGQLLSVLNGPARGLVTVLSGNPRNLLNVVNAIREKKG